MSHVIDSQADNILPRMGNGRQKAYLPNRGSPPDLIWVLAGRILQKLLLRLADVLYQLLHGLIIHIQGSKGIDPASVPADDSKSGFVFNFICN